MTFAKKSLGQNFLIDKNIVRKILGLINLKDKNIIEIGPGKGALTDEILKQKPKSIILIEKDNILFEHLLEKYSDKKSIKVLNSDILKYDLDEINKKNLIVLGNLPYNISSQILIKFLRYSYSSSKFSNLIFMFQKELGEKIISKFPSKKYGRLSIITNLIFNVEKSFLVSPNCFFPKPTVTSMVIHFKKGKKKSKITKMSNLEKITNIFFSNKRKMINKNIKKILSEKKINQVSNLNLNSRPGEISPKVYYKITELYEEE
jgi:16S rRNA (adenine1518-N6/adenine1519-N6)-dimethyltransferase